MRDGTARRRARSMIQWRAAAAHCRQARSRPAYSSSGPSWTIVSSRCVSGLSTGWRPVSASTTSPNASAAAPMRRLAPHRGAGRRPAQRDEVGAASGQRDRDQHEKQHRLRRRRRRSGRGSRPSGRSRCRCPTRTSVIAKRPEREQADEHEGVVAEPPIRRAARRSARSTSADQRSGRDDCRRQLVERACAARRDAALAPQPAQLAVRLKRRRAAAAPAGAPCRCWTEPGSSGRPAQRRRAAARRPRRPWRAHASTPEPQRARAATPAAPAGRRGRRAGCPTADAARRAAVRSAPARRLVDERVEQVRHLGVVADLLDDAAPRLRRSSSRRRPEHRLRAPAAAAW